MTVLTRPVMYCIVPSELAAELLAPLRAHFEHQGVTVIEERRDPRKPVSLEVRRQRAMHLPRALGDLPAGVAAHAAALKLVQRMPPPGLAFADATLAEVLGAVQDGDGVAASELVWRLSARIVARLDYRHGQRGIALLDPALGHMLDCVGECSGYEENEILMWVDSIVDDLR